MISYLYVFSIEDLCNDEIIMNDSRIPHRRTDKITGESTNPAFLIPEDYLFLQLNIQIPQICKNHYMRPSYIGNGSNLYKESHSAKSYYYLVFEYKH